MADSANKRPLSGYPIFKILTTSLEGSSTTHMDLVSATLKPVKKVKVTRSGNSKTRAA
jgi:hypothetical protein